MTSFDERREMMDELRRAFATREDFGKLRADFADQRSDIKGEIAGLRAAMGEMRGELGVKIADVKSDVIRWMFAFFVTMLLAILGLYFKR